MTKRTSHYWASLAGPQGPILGFNYLCSNGPEQSTRDKPKVRPQFKQTTGLTWAEIFIGPFCEFSFLPKFERARKYICSYLGGRIL